MIAPDEQLGADFAFQLLNLAAERRLRDVQPPGSVRETEFFGDDDERAFVRESQRDRAPETRCSARHDGSSIGETARHGRTAYGGAGQSAVGTDWPRSVGTSRAK